MVRAMKSAQSFLQEKLKIAKVCFCQNIESALTDIVTFMGPLLPQALSISEQSDIQSKLLLIWRWDSQDVHFLLLVVVVVVVSYAWNVFSKWKQSSEFSFLSFVWKRELCNFFLQKLLQPIRYINVLFSSYPSISAI